MADREQIAADWAPRGFTGIGMTERTRWIGLVVFLVVCLGAGGLGAVATTPEIEGWYKSIAKPSWTPPDAVFGPVWTSLYVLMAVATWLVASAVPGLGQFRRGAEPRHLVDERGLNEKDAGRLWIRRSPDSPP